MKKRNSCSKLRHKLTLQEELHTADDIGGHVRTWKTIADLWAEIIPVGGNEKFFSHRLESNITHRILLRYRPDISVGNRLLFENRAFNIRFVLNTQEKDEMLELHAEEGNAS